jgi:hypothetical protein
MFEVGNEFLTICVVAFNVLLIIFYLLHVTPKAFLETDALYVETTCQFRCKNVGNLCRFCEMLIQ